MGPLTNARAEQFAANVASGLSATQAYIKAGYSKNGAGQGGERLLKKVEVRARVDELTQKVVEETVRITISSREARLHMYEEMQRRLWLIVEERGRESAMAKVAGGRGGFIVRQIKSVGSGAAQKIVPEYVADVALSREIRAIAEQESKELGQWIEKSDATVRVPQLKEMSEDELRRMLADLGVQEDLNAGNPTGTGPASAAAEQV